MLKTFNCGIGMVLCVNPDRAGDLTALLRETGETVTKNRPRHDDPRHRLFRARSEIPMKRVAILISGGGSNMVKLCDSMTGDHPARPVLGHVERSRGRRARPRAGRWVCRSPSPITRDFDTRPGFEAALQAELDRYSPDIICLAGFMRILTPGFVCALRRPDAQHPSVASAQIYRAEHPCPCDCGRRRSGGLHGPSGHAGPLDDGPILGQARVDDLRPGDTPSTLAARVLSAEHRLYPGRAAAVCRRYHDAIDAGLAGRNT